MKKFPILAKLKSLRTDVDSLNDSFTAKMGNGRIKFVSIATDGTSIGFQLSYASNASFAIFYFDNSHRVASITKQSPNNSEIIELHSTFVAKGDGMTDTYLRVGNWCRGTFLIDSTSEIRIKTYST